MSIWICSKGVVSHHNIRARRFENIIFSNNDYQPEKNLVSLGAWWHVPLFRTLLLVFFCILRFRPETCQLSEAGLMDGWASTLLTIVYICSFEKKRNAWSIHCAPAHCWPMAPTSPFHTLVFLTSQDESPSRHCGMRLPRLSSESIGIWTTTSLYLMPQTLQDASLPMWWLRLERVMPPGLAFWRSDCRLRVQSSPQETDWKGRLDLPPDLAKPHAFLHGQHKKRLDTSPYWKIQIVFNSWCLV